MLICVELSIPVEGPFQYIFITYCLLLVNTSLIQDLLILTFCKNSVLIGNNFHFTSSKFLSESRKFCIIIFQYAIRDVIPDKKGERSTNK